MMRYLVTVRQEYIFYAADSVEAARKGKLVSESAEVLSVKELPPLDKEVQKPVIDVSPINQKRA
jgi:hypothetical protein